MTALIDPRTADRLAKLCGMFGSHHDSKRASAAEKADKLLSQHGFTWQQVISVPRPLAPKAFLRRSPFALANIGALSMWERRFIYDVNGRRSLSPKQLVVLEQILAKVLAYRTGAS
jgi:hypothetical protein